jgi:hypothetical protein
LGDHLKQSGVCTRLSLERSIDRLLAAKSPAAETSGALFAETSVLLIDTNVSNYNGGRGSVEWSGATALLWFVHSRGSTLVSQGTRGACVGIASRRIPKVGEHEMKQRLAAILAADVEGYSRLMAADENAR